jgi:hypothetical protein
MTTPPDPTEREGPGRRMTRGRETPPGERLGKLGQHTPLVEKHWLNPNWRTGGNALRDWPGGSSRRKYGLRRREGGGAGAEPVRQETREKVGAGE